MHEITLAMEKLVQHYRHDFLNVLQVIGGLAQMQKTDRLLAFIRKSSEEVQQIGRLISCGDPRFALAVYEQLLQGLKGTYVIEVDDVLPLLDTQILSGLAALLAAIQSFLEDFEEYTLSIHIQGGKKPKLNLCLIGDLEPQEKWLQIQDAACKHGLSAVYRPANHEFSLLLDKRESKGEK